MPLIRLRQCAGWSGALLFANTEDSVSCDNLITKVDPDHQMEDSIFKEYKKVQICRMKTVCLVSISFLLCLLHPSVMFALANELF